MEHCDAINGLDPCCTRSKSHLQESMIKKKDTIATESFWKEALQADSLLSWIVFHIGNNREERT